MIDQPSLLDWTPDTAVKRRDAGLERVRLNNADWMAQALRLIEKELRYTMVSFTGEQLRHAVDERIGNADPHAYGALVTVALKRDLIKPTGRYEKMTDLKSHGRETKVYCGSQRKI